MLKYFCVNLYTYLIPQNRTEIFFSHEMQSYDQNQSSDKQFNNF